LADAAKEECSLDLKERLQTHLSHVVRERDPFLATQGHFYVREYIRQELGKWGEVETGEFEVGGRKHQNLLLNLPQRGVGGGNKKPIILIGAHYDAVLGSPGADDNATGVAVLLEFARLFDNAPANYPIRLVAFDMEEFGLEGSNHCAAELKQQGQKIRLMLSLEMLGYCNSSPGSQRYPAGLERFYPNRGDFIALIGNLPTIPDLIRLSGSIRKAGIPSEWLPVPNRGTIVPDTRRSDHAPFWDRGYRAMMVTDTANMRNPHYHDASDRMETLNLDFLTGICRGLADGIRRL
jgi:Zn-dependent M28 family amino/carboxypeptidase